MKEFDYVIQSVRTGQCEYRYRDIESRILQVRHDPTVYRWLMFPVARLAP